MKLVKFIKSPIGAFGLAYAPNEIAEIENTQADELISLGFAELLENKAETADKIAPKAVKKAVK